ncbi:transposase [Vibrio parahaemolyticus]|uniref:transposase n=4 Tax=Vibrio parahaemolyticus TaxID=670 RepID=UPI0003FD843B|nr:transposase [Vibrio parahaemolyticus]AOV88903.1 DDE superendonuclease family protein [Vibrio parahaemolyticus]MBE3793748.1 hypothetical protein [Vibrio parahaemolyticus]MDF4642235.1 transposase [Vibrio parahaemolyticus]
MYAYLFGSVCPRKGIGEAIVVPWVHKDIMIEHLAVTEEGRHAVVVMDGAGWHTEKLPMTLNVSVIKLSPYSPELNPIEQVWRWLRQRDLSNQSFMDYDDIISKSAMHGIGFGLLPKSHQNVLEKVDRPDQLIFQIGINGEVVELQIIENGLSWKGK